MAFHQFILVIIEQQYINNKHVTLSVSESKTKSYGR